MNKRDLAQIKKILTRMLADQLRGADCNLAGIREPDDQLPDPVDRAANITERNLSHNICVRESLLRRRIEQSLQDIENGEYGSCERCGDDIAIKRLKANPVARHCVDCKSEIEKRERLVGT
jgi:DnaK suppressor protein